MKLLGQRSNCKGGEMCLHCPIKEKSKAEIKNKAVWGFHFPLTSVLYSPSPPPASSVSPLLPTPPHFPVDSHNTRRACSLLLSPGAREGWSTAQVMRALSSLRLTFRVSSLLTLYVGSSGTDTTTSGRPEVKRDEKGRGQSRGRCLHLNRGTVQHKAQTDTKIHTKHKLRHRKRVFYCNLDVVVSCCTTVQNCSDPHLFPLNEKQLFCAVTLCPWVFCPAITVCYIYCRSSSAFPRISKAISHILPLKGSIFSADSFGDAYQSFVQWNVII